MWYNILFFVISGWTYTVIDNQLPSRKNKNMFLMFTFMAFGLVCIGVGGVVSGQMAIESGMWILVGMMLICFGFGLYCLYCWRRRVLWYKEIALQRELRAKRKKKLEY
jgi:sulfite exporter TauE/SafE